MTDTHEYIQSMVLSQPLMEGTICSAIQALQLPQGSRGLDAGCGIGLQTILLAEALGPSGHVTGLDISPEFLSHGEDLVKKSGLSERISFKEGDVCILPFENSAFDWVWSSFCVGYSASIEPLGAIKELARVVKPGGTVAIFTWSSEMLLPGYPLLEARLDATTSGIAPFIKGKKPELHFLRALGWFREAGLEELTAQTFAGGTHAPLTDELRNALLALLEMRWPGVESELAAEDWMQYQALCLPESPEFILDHPDYYAFFNCSLFFGKVVK